MVDAPEEAALLLERAGISDVGHLFLSHWHPDHTAGFRALELLNLALGSFRARACTQVWMNAETEARRAADWRWFESRGYCRLNVVPDGATIELGGLRATWFEYEQICSGFLLDDGATRVLLLVDETMAAQAGQLAALPGVLRPDLLVLQCGWFERDPEGTVVIPPGHRLRELEASFERDTLPIVRAVGARRTLLVHLGELQQYLPAELDAVAAGYPELGLTFAYDGLELAV